MYQQLFIYLNYMYIGYALLDMLQIINKWSESEKSYNILARDKLGFQQGFQITSNHIYINIYLYLLVIYEYINILFI